MAANDPLIHLHDVRRLLFSDDDEETSEICPAANDHEISGSSKGVIDVSSEKK